MTSRRRFLETAATLTAATAVLSPWPAVALTSPAMQSRPIPATGETLPVIGIGTSGSFEVDAAGREPLKEVLRRFVAGGGSVIDTSPNYSNAEDVLVDLLAVHNLRDWKTQLALARGLKRDGKVRYVGLTHYVDERHDELADLVASEKPDFVQINYSVAAPNAERRLLPAAKAHGVAVMVNRAFDDGRLFARVAGRALPAWAAAAGVDSWAQMFLRFATSHPAATVVIPATGKPDRQDDNLRAGRGPALTESQRAELVAMFA